MGHITAEVCTKGRYDSTLPLTLLSIAGQTRPPDRLIIMDDNEPARDLQKEELYQYLFDHLKQRGIPVTICPGLKRGQHFSHQLVQMMAEGEYVFRIDDDVCAEPRCLEFLEAQMKEGVGAVAPLVLFKNPDHKDIPADYGTKMDNAQWHIFEGIKKSEHLYSVFLYRKGITHYELALSKAAHREETIFSMKIRKAGYRLLIEPKAICRHFRFPTGGIRSPGYTKEMFDADEKIFQEIYQEIKTDTKIIHLNCGLGDHIVLKGLFPEIKQRYAKLKICATYPEVFKDEPDCELLSIADGNKITTPDRHHVYKLMGMLTWPRPIADAFRMIYL